MISLTRTATATRTFTRMDLMKMQIQRILLRCRVDTVATSKLLLGVSKKWIHQISLYGMDTNGQCVGELFVAIDWTKNELHVAAGRNTVTIDQRWQDDIAIEVEMALKLFEELCQAELLSTTWQCRYRANIDGSTANEHLGFRNATPVTWRGGFTGAGMSIPELDEFTVGVRIAG
jgi:hypothetical protein